MVDGGQAVDLPRRKHRALLAALLLHAPEPVSPDRLIEELWGESPPRTARDALQNYVSLLRKALGADVLVTRDAGYVLAITPEQVDLGRFERLSAEGRTATDVAERAAKLREALELWRGPPLADLAFEPFAALEIARLEELRLAAREDLLDAELELGRHADLVPELERLIEDHRFDERLRGQLMLALYRAGRQVEALEAYQAARHVLDEELGLEPGTPLRELEQAILRHDPALDGTRAAAPTASRRTVTVLFATLAAEEERDPESAGGPFGAVETTIERHGGRAGFVGDAAVGIFGAPTLHEDDALRAVRAAAALRDVLPDARIGLSTGEVLAAGEAVTGPPVNAARQLEQAAEPGETLVARRHAPARPRRRADEPVERRGAVAFRLDELRPGAPGLARHFDTPMVDREAELAELRRAFEAARDERRCVVFTGLGEAGIGKTRLARELVAQVSDEATVLVGRCVSYGEGATYLPLREMIGEGFDAAFDAAGSTGEVFLATRRRFEEIARDRPLLLVFEDVHWAEPTLLDLIEYLGAQATGSPIFALCLSRPDLLAERAGWSEIGPSLVLEPLTDDHARELVGARPHAERIVEIAEGNPLYAEQLSAYAEEGGAGALDTVPASIEALLASRLDRVDPEERAFASGPRSSAAASRPPRSPPSARSTRSRASSTPASSTARGRSTASTTCSCATSSTPGRRSPSAPMLHRRHADWLAAQADGSDELVGYHLEQAAGYLRELGAPEEEIAQLADAAGRRLGAAGIRAWKRADATTTINLLERATALLPELDPERLEWMCELGQALRTAGELTRARAAYEAARAQAAAAGERRIELRADMEALEVRLLLDPEIRPDELLERATAAIPVLEERADDRGLGRAWMMVSHVHGPYRLRHRQAGEAARRALVHYRRAGWPVGSCLGAIAGALYYGPTPVGEAISTCEELLADATPVGQAGILAFLGGLEAMRGDFPKARTFVAETRRTYSQLGQFIAAELSSGSVETEVERLAGDLEKARELVEASHAILEEHGGRAYLATRAATLADVLYRQGRLEDAARYAAAAESGSTSGDLATEWRWRSVAAKLAARAGESDRAELLAREAVGLLADTDALHERGRCSLDLAEVLTLSGRPAEAATALRDALALFEQKGSVVAAEQTRALLAETTESP